MKMIVLAACCIAGLGLTGCGGNENTPRANTSAPPSTAPPTGIVEGILQMVGGPEGAEPTPIAGTVTFKNGNSVTKAQVDQTGKFAIGLYPGTYEIRGTSPSYNSGHGLCVTGTPTTLTAGKTVTVKVNCNRR